MKAAVFYDVDDFRVEDIPIPKTGAGELLVRTRACGICSTDIFKAAYRRAKQGAVLGHEITGDVEEVGSGVDHFTAGERVAVLHHAPCGACYYCLRGQEPMCEQYRRLGIIPGGFAQYIRVLPELVRKTVVRIPDEMSFDEATMIEPTACCVRALTKCSVLEGDAVLIVGDGPLGLIHSQLSSSFGASKVIVSGHHDFRLEKARELGVEYTYNSKKTNVEEKVKELTEERGADIVIVAVASTAAVHEGIDIVREGGKICLFGDFRDVPQPDLEIDPNLMISHRKTIFGSWGCSPRDYHVAFELIKAGRVKIKPMITHRFPIERFPEAVELMKRKGECLKIVVNP